MIHKQKAALASQSDKIDALNEADAGKKKQVEEYAALLAAAKDEIAVKDAEIVRLQAENVRSQAEVKSLEGKLGDTMQKIARRDNQIGINKDKIQLLEEEIQNMQAKIRLAAREEELRQQRRESTGSATFHQTDRQPSPSASASPSRIDNERSPSVEGEL